jgi:hypothetical protein
MVQPTSDNGQKSPTTGASSLAFQNSGSPNLFSFSSQKKTTAYGGMTIHQFIPLYVIAFMLVVILFRACVVMMCRHI